ncbi:MAG: hypothetical protein QOJ92_262, partial [Frankiales bacterium]|nr:hypothetical protein [Frankiales bacterium]
MTQTVHTINLDTLVLERGCHATPDEGMCLIESASVFNGDPKMSDQTPCVSPVLRHFGITLNDRLDDTRRQQLKRFVPLLPGTNTGAADDAKRRAMARCFLLEQALPEWLRLANREDLADRVAGLIGQDLIAINDELWRVHKEIGVDWSTFRAQVREAVKARCAELQLPSEAAAAAAAA